MVYGFGSWFLTHWQNAFRAIVPLLIISFIFFQEQEKLLRIDPSATLQLLRELEWTVNIILLTAAFAAVSSMVLYDLIIARRLNFSMSFAQLFRVSWISNTFNNVMSFGGLTGGGLRILFYREQNAPLKNVLDHIALLSFSVLTGSSVLAVLLLTDTLPVRFILSENPWMYIFISLAILYLPVYLLIQRLPELAERLIGTPLPGKVSASFLLSSIIEWALAAFTFYIACRALDADLSPPTAMGIFVLAGIAGVFSLAPGGLGAFDLTVLISLQTAGVPEDASLGILLLFRFYYYLVPWLLSAIIGATSWARDYEQWTPKLQSAYQRSKGYGSKLYRFAETLRVFGDFGIWSLSLLVFAGGLTLLLSAAIPGISERIAFEDSGASVYSVFLSRQAAVITGILLIILSKGIKQKVGRAFKWTLGALAAGVVFSLFNGFDYWEAIFLSVIGFLLWLSRDRFYRKGIKYPAVSYLRWMFLTSALGAAYFTVALLWAPEQEYYFHRSEADIILISTAIDVAVVWFVLSLWFILKKEQIPEQPLSTEEFFEVEEFLENHKGNHLMHLIWLNDKQLFWGAERNVLIPYANVRNTLVALGDPVGDPQGFSKAIGEFRKFADSYGKTPVFYHVTSHHLQLFHDHGYRFFKLGEEAVVNLPDFTLKGKSKTDFRTVRNRLEREGFTFNLLSPPFSDEQLDQLQKISDSWIGKRKEKGFSLGWFDRNYLQKAPIAVVRTPENTIIAFATLMPGYDGGRSFAIDLMRYSADSPRGVMDYLFIQLILWGQTEGFETFSLGMAPLASVGQNEFAHRDEKLANWVAKAGNQWYGFQGLRRYKQKFDPDWNPRYFAYPTNSSLARRLLEVTRLISEKRR